MLNIYNWKEKVQKNTHCTTVLSLQGVRDSHQSRDPCVFRCKPESNWSSRLPPPFHCQRTLSRTPCVRSGKVAAVNPTSIPRLQLCGAVMAVQAVDRIMKEIDMPISEVLFYTYSEVVLGYTCNESRRFYLYVANRVQMIRVQISSPDQWRYVESCNNPADVATRSLHESEWINAHEFLRNN